MIIQEKKNPQEIIEYDGTYPKKSLPVDVVEIFQTPLTGSYNWDYTVQDNRIRKLYDLGKKLNWDVEVDVDWTPEYLQSMEDEEFNFEDNQWANHPVYKTWDKEKRLAFLTDMNSTL